MPSGATVKPSAASRPRAVARSTTGSTKWSSGRIGAGVLMAADLPEIADGFKANVRLRGTTRSGGLLHPFGATRNHPPDQRRGEQHEGGDQEGSAREGQP